MADKLRKAEKDILIPRMVEYKITHTLCREEQRLFAECAKENGFLVVVKCRDLMKEFTKCSNRWWNNEEFRKSVEDEYLHKRDHFRKTGEAEPSPFKRFGK